ncbi:MFS transporter, MCP family, solute carrier family 16, member 6 [Trichoderma velutinum]
MKAFRVQHLESGEATHEPPPDGGYGWVIVISCFTLNAFTWGVTSSFGVYLSEYKRSDRFSDASHLEFGFVSGLNFSCAMILAFPVTYFARRLGIHAPMLVGCVLQCAGYISASFASKSWHLILTQGVTVGSGIGCIIIPSTAILSQWFSKRRAIANGISSAGSGVGGVAFSWGTGAMIQHQGLSWTLRITGLITLLTTVVATLLLRDRNHQVRPTQIAVDFSLLRHTKVLLLLLWTFVSMFGYIALLFSLSDFALAVGLSSTQATDIVGFLNLGTAVGRPIIGLISDRTSKVATAGILTFLCGIICFALWLPAASFGLTTLFAILCGAIVGVFWMTIGPLCAEVEGLRNLPSLLALAWATTVIPTACAEVITLRLAELPAPRPYLYPQIFAGFSYIIASVFLAQLWLLMRKEKANV